MAATGGPQIVSIISKDMNSFFKVNVVVNGVCYKLLIPSVVEERPFTMQYTTRRGRVARFKAMPNTTVMLKPPAAQQMAQRAATAQTQQPRPGLQTYIRAGNTLQLIRPTHPTLTPGGIVITRPTQRLPTSVNPPLAFSDFDNEEVMEGVDDAFMFYDDDVEECETTLLEDAASTAGVPGAGGEGAPRDDDDTDTASEASGQLHAHTTGSGDVGARPVTQPHSSDSNLTQTMTSRAATAPTTIQGPKKNASIDGSITARSADEFFAKTPTPQRHATEKNTQAEKTNSEKPNTKKSNTEKPNTEKSNTEKSNATSEIVRHTSVKSKPATDKGKKSTPASKQHSLAIQNPDEGASSPHPPPTRGRSAPIRAKEMAPVTHAHLDTGDLGEEVDDCLILSEPPTSSESDSDSDPSFNFGCRRRRKKRRRGTGKVRRRRKRDSDYRPHFNALSHIDWRDMTLNVTTRGTVNKDLHPGLIIPPDLKLKPCRVVLHKLQVPETIIQQVQADHSPQSKLRSNKHKLPSHGKEQINSGKKRSKTNNHDESEKVVNESQEEGTEPNLESKETSSPQVNVTATTTQPNTPTTSVTATVSTATTSLTTTTTTSTASTVTTATSTSNNAQNKFVLIKTNAGNFLVPVDSPLVMQAKNLSSAASGATAATKTSTAVVNLTTSSAPQVGPSILTAASGAPVLRNSANDTPRVSIDIATTQAQRGVDMNGVSIISSDVSDEAEKSNTDSEKGSSEKPAETVMEERIRRLKEMLKQKEEEVELFRKKRTENVDKS